jgi:hypothetical protein
MHLARSALRVQTLFVPFRALAGIKISSFSTSQVAFECAWTGIFTFLHIGIVQFANLSYAVPVSSELKTFFSNSGKHLCHAKRPSRVL